MIWNSLSEFIAMGGYADYVWGSFGVTALLMVIEVVQARYARQHTLQRLRNLQDAQGDAKDLPA